MAPRTRAADVSERHPGSGEETTVLETGVSIDSPVGTALQYRCTGVDTLQFICVTMLPGPGCHEATIIEGPWRPNAPRGWPVDAQ